MEINKESSKYCIEELKWDTNFFKVKSAKVTLNSSIKSKDLETILQKIDYNNYEFVTINNTKNNDNNNYVLKDVCNIFLSDVNIQFEKRVEKIQEIDNKVHVQNKLKYDQDILEIAKKNFKYSRFMNDLKLGKASDVYVEWTKNSFDKTNKYFCTYEINEKIVGYVLFSIREKTSLIIELIAVSNTYKRKGIGRKMIKKIEEFAYLNDVNYIKVGTQLNNIDAQNFYISNGFKHVSNNSIYHFWARER